MKAFELSSMLQVGVDLDLLLDGGSLSKQT